jgi:hypothetical protein
VDGYLEQDERCFEDDGGAPLGQNHVKHPEDEGEGEGVGEDRQEPGGGIHNLQIMDQQIITLLCINVAKFVASLEKDCNIGSGEKVLARATRTFKKHKSPARSLDSVMEAPHV